VDAKLYVSGLVPKTLTKSFPGHNLCVQWNLAHHNHITTTSVIGSRIIPGIRITGPAQ
jgi:hypothetical protein